MLEILKTFIEAPEKLGSILIKITRILFNLVFAAWIYKTCVGPYTLFEWSDSKAWTEFIMSGRMVLCIVFYGIASTILFEFLPALSFIPLKWLSHKSRPLEKIDKSTSTQVLQLLDLFKLLKVDFKGGKVKAAEHTDELYDFVKEFSKKKTRREIRSIKNALITDVWHFYVLFVIAYFTYLKSMVHTGWMTFLIVMGCIILPYIYVVSAAVLDKLHESSKDILFYLSNVMTEKEMIDNLRELDIFPRDYAVGNKGRLVYAFHYEEEDHLLYFHFSKRPLADHELEQFTRVADAEKKKFVLISTVILSEKAQTLLDSGNGKFQVISWAEKSELTELLRSNFGGKVS